MKEDLHTLLVAIRSDIANVSDRIDKLQASEDSLRHEFKRLERRIDEHSDDIKQLKSSGRQNSSASIEHETSIARVEIALGAIVNELGIGDRVNIGASTPPGARGPALARLVRENRNSVLASVATTVLVVVQIVWRLLEGTR